jgi:hypothetical protein
MRTAALTNDLNRSRIPAIMRLLAAGFNGMASCPFLKLKRNALQLA